MGVLQRVLLALASLAICQSAAAVEALQISERQAGNSESWVALSILTASVMTAWFLNHNAPKVRVFGSILAASGCFAVAA